MSEKLTEETIRQMAEDKYKFIKGTVEAIVALQRSTYAQALREVALPLQKEIEQLKAENEEKEQRIIARNDLLIARKKDCQFLIDGIQRIIRLTNFNLGIDWREVNETAKDALLKYNSEQNPERSVATGDDSSNAADNQTK